MMAAIDKPPLFTPREINLAYAVHFTAAIAVVTMLALGVFGHLTGTSGARIMGATLIGGAALSVGSLLFVLRRSAKQLSNDDWDIKYNKFRQQLLMASFLCAVVFGILGITGTLAASDLAKGFLIGSSLLAIIHVGYRAEDKIDYLIMAMMVALVVLNALASTNVISGDAVRYALGGAIMIVSSASLAKTFYKGADPLVKKMLGLLWVADMLLGLLGIQGTLQTPALLANSTYIKDEAATVVLTFTAEAKYYLQTYNLLNAPRQVSA